MDKLEARVLFTGESARFKGKAIATAGVDEWVEALSRVYSRHRLLYSQMSDYWMHATNAAQAVAEEVRRDRPLELIRCLGSAFAWCCTTASYVLSTLQGLKSSDDPEPAGSTYGEWIAYKYPGRCHYCGWSSCRCPSQRQILEERNDQSHPHYKEIRQEYERIHRERTKPSPEEVRKYQQEFVALNLQDQIARFDLIYQAANFERSLENICFHYLEEVGEVAREMSWFEALERIRTDKSLLDVYKEQFKNVLTGKDIRPDIEEWTTRALLDPPEGQKRAAAFLGTLSDMEVQAQIRRLQFAYCTAVMAELTDVFSWTTGIDYKIRQASGRVKVLRVDLPSYLCDVMPSLDESERKAYIFKVGDTDHAQCAYCGEKICTERCVSKRLIVEAVKKRVKQELS